MKLGLASGGNVEYSICVEGSLAVFCWTKNAVVLPGTALPSTSKANTVGQQHFLFWGGNMDEYGSDWPILRKKALKRDQYRCAYCRETKQLHVHHIRPLLQGGKNILWNLITLCRTCHIEEHREIRQRGLCVIPGPAYEEHRHELTNQKDVLRYADYLDSIGLSGDRLRELEQQ